MVDRASWRFPVLVDTLRSRYQAIIVDTPPLLRSDLARVRRPTPTGARSLCRPGRPQPTLMKPQLSSGWSEPNNPALCSIVWVGTSGIGRALATCSSVIAATESPHCASPCDRSTMFRPAAPSIAERPGSRSRVTKASASLRGSPIGTISPARSPITSRIPCTSVATTERVEASASSIDSESVSYREGCTTTSAAANQGRTSRCAPAKHTALAVGSSWSRTGHRPRAADARRESNFDHRPSLEQQVLALLFAETPDADDERSFADVQVGPSGVPGTGILRREPVRINCVWNNVVASSDAMRLTGAAFAETAA